jgi:hypothetical protein
MKLFKILLGAIVFLPIFPVVAQIPSVPQIPSTPTIPSVPPLKPSQQNLGDIPQDPTQMRSWVCIQGSDRIAVSAKEVKGWKALIEKQGWQCSEGNTDIPDRTPSFSCEPEQTLGVLSVYWLGGKNGKTQLTSWKDNLSAQQGMVCTLNNVQLFDTQNNIIPQLNR